MSREYVIKNLIHSPFVSLLPCPSLNLPLLSSEVYLWDCLVLHFAPQRTTTISIHFQVFPRHSQGLVRLCFRRVLGDRSRYRLDWLPRLFRHPPQPHLRFLRFLFLCPHPRLPHPLFLRPPDQKFLGGSFYSFLLLCIWDLLRYRGIYEENLDLIKISGVNSRNHSQKLSGWRTQPQDSAHEPLKKWYVPHHQSPVHVLPSLRGQNLVARGVSAGNRVFEYHKRTNRCYLIQLSELLSQRETCKTGSCIPNRQLFTRILTLGRHWNRTKNRTKNIALDLNFDIKSCDILLFLVLFHDFYEIRRKGVIKDEEEVKFFSRWAMWRGVNGVAAVEV